MGAHRDDQTLVAGAQLVAAGAQLVAEAASPGEGTADDRRIAALDLPLILMYHVVAAYPEDPYDLCVTPQRFAEQMEWLARRGLRGVGIKTLLDAMHDRRHRGLVGITFDDGYEALRAGAMPTLRSKGFSATVFVVSELIGGTNSWDVGAPSWPLLSADGVVELAAEGIEIASHGARHLPLGGADAHRLEHEVASSRATLTELLGTEISGFAYPHGSVDDAARAEVHRAGYRYACAVENVARPGTYALPRVTVVQRDSLSRLRVKRLAYRPFFALQSARQSRRAS